MRATRSITPVVYQMKVTLKGIKPPIWRCIQVARTTPLAQLHRYPTGDGLGGLSPVSVGCRGEGI